MTKSRIEKKFSKGTEEYKLMDSLISSFTQNERTSYVYALSLIQTVHFFLFNRKLPPVKFHHFFLTDYFPNTVGEDNILDLHYLSITKYYLKKMNIDYDKIKDRMLATLSRIHKRPFKDMEEFLEYYITNETTDCDYKKIAAFIG